MQGLQTAISTIARLRDKKNLVESALKLGEEYGELAQQVLIYWGTHGTQYRNAQADETRAKLLEELADVYICLYALVYKLGFNDSELHKEIARKVEKWRNSLPYDTMNTDLSKKTDQ